MTSAKTPRELEFVRRATHQGTFVTLPCLEVEVDDKILRYAETNDLIYGRVLTLYTKEPTTIPWLETMRPDEVLVDIGATIGLYSVFAAVVAGCRVYSFEPEALNYAELNKNIYLNDLHGRVSAYCLAMSDEQRVGHLHLGAFGAGYSHHDFNQNTWTKDMVFGRGTTKKEQRVQQGSVSTSLDALVASGAVPPPSHIKIDVDGLEHRVMAGCRETLRHPDLKTVLLEVDFSIPECRTLIEEMTALGWRYSLDQLRTNRSAILTEEKIQQLWCEQRAGFNYIFFRSDDYADVFRDFLARYEPPLGAHGKMLRPPKVIGTNPTQPSPLRAMAEGGYRKIRGAMGK
ncbi:MAG: FkbM family methyltransferase [Planctomycetota bacterium]